jgi:WD40 repeat protein
MRERVLLWKRRVVRALGGYDAFLSYRHGADRARVVAVQRALHHIGKPWWKFRAASVFRDEDGLPLTEAFWPMVESALRASRHVVLFASPATRDSKWIPRELEVWRSMQPRPPLCIVVTGGGVRWNEETKDFDWDVTDALPRSLEGVIKQEPLWADLRGIADADLDLKKEAFRAQAVKIAAAVHDTTPELMESYDRRQHRKTMTLAWSVAALLALALVSVISLLINVSAEKWRATESAKQARLLGYREIRQARIARNNEALAVQQRQRAEREQARAEREARQALARQLAAQATSLQNEQLAVAANLSLAATRLAPTVESRASLLSVVQRHPQLERLIETGFPAGPQMLQMSGDGAYLAVSSWAQPPKLWDLREGREVAFPVPMKKLTVFAFAPDGATCAIARDGGEVEIWDLTHRRLLHVVHSGMKAVASVALEAGAEHLVAIGESARLFDVASGARIAECQVQMPEGAVTIRLAAQRRLVIEAGADVVLIDLATGKKLDLQPLDPNAVARDVASDGTTVALGTEKGSIEIWNLALGSRMAQIAGDGLQSSRLRFSNDGTHLISVSGGSGNDPAERARSFVSIWDVRTGARVGRRIEGLPGPLWSLAADGDLACVAAITRQSPIRIWRTTASHLLAQRLAGDSDDDIWRAVGSARAETFLVQHRDGSVVVADPHTGRVRQTLLPSLNGRRIRTMNVSADGAYAIVSEAPDDFKPPAAITVWRLPSETPLLTMIDGVDSNTIAMSADHRYLAWARDRTHLVVYDLEHRRDALVVPLPFRHPLLIRFVDDDRALLMVDTAAFARLDLATHKTAVTRTESMSSHAISADGRIIAAVQNGQEVHTWDSRTGRETGPPLVGDAGALLLAVALNGDGSLLVASTFAGGVLLWDRLAGRRLGAPLVGHDRGVTELMLSSDGLTMFTRESRGSWLRWQLDPAALRSRACELANRNLTRDEWSFYVPGQPYQAVCSASDFGTGVRNARAAAPMTPN